MYSLIIGFLTILLILNALFLLLVVLMQLPRKEAGLGVAFGGSAAEALFGAGTGTILSKATTYGTISFLSLCLILSLLYVRGAYGSKIDVLKQLATEQTTMAQRALALTNVNGAVTNLSPGLTNEHFGERPAYLPSVSSSTSVVQQVGTNQPSNPADTPQENR